MNIKLSIIIPVFNGERFIGRCLESLANQLRDDVEIIVVNDGSTDATDTVITAGFQSLINSGRLLYLTTPNAGVSAARNLGLDRASGDYVAFVDADDVVRPNYMVTILRAMTDTPDIIEFGYRNIDELGQVIIPGGGFVHTKFGKHPPGAILNTVFSACLWYPFLRVIRRSLFDGIRFPVGVRFCEDLMTLSVVYKRAGTICSLPDILYDYRINPAGATQNPKPDYAANLINFYRRIAHERSFANKALKINLAYAIRGCIAKTTDPLGRLPQDIGQDVRRLIWTPTLLLNIRRQRVMYAIAGPLLNFVKGLMK